MFLGLTKLAIGDYYNNENLGDIRAIKPSENGYIFEMYVRKRYPAEITQLDILISPFYDDKYIIPFRISGKTYQAKKADLRQQAIDYSNIQGVLTLYWSEVAEISNFFERNGKRYGLLKEFRENGIC